MPEHATASIVLAAGSSRRLGRPKQLLVYESETLLARTVRIALEAGAAPVCVVLGANADACRDALAGLPVTIAENPGYDEGMGGSLALAMTTLTSSYPQIERVLVLVCDQPLLAAEHLRKLLALPGPLAAAAYSGRIGVPAVFDRAYFPALIAASGDEGMRGLLRTHCAAVTEMPLPEAALDLDTPADFDQLPGALKKP